jgi:hypothetical protein
VRIARLFLRSAGVVRNLRDVSSGFVGMSEAGPGIILPDPAQNFFNAIVIVIEIIFRIDQTLLKIFQADFDKKILSRP